MLKCLKIIFKFIKFLKMGLKIYLKFIKSSNKIQNSCLKTFLKSKTNILFSSLSKSTMSQLFRMLELYFNFISFRYFLKLLKEISNSGIIYLVIEKRIRVSRKYGS